MNDFWNNISRYPRFFISSVIGLILVILAPFRNLLKIKNFQFILPLVFIVFLAILYKILTIMVGL
jgi:purine-cytosine permease-like protein